MSELKEIIGKNLTRLRLERNWTQTELADKLNYTDKSVSKWEHGDATPPIETLKLLADLYGVSIDYLITPEPDLIFERAINADRNSLNKIIITLLAVSLVWLIATIAYVYGVSLAHESYWQVFIYAIPFTCILLVIFNSIWGKKIFTLVIISVFVWSVLLSVFITFIQYAPWAVFLIGAPIQIAIILWAQLIPHAKKPRNTKKKNVKNNK